MREIKFRAWDAIDKTMFNYEDLIPEAEWEYGYDPLKSTKDWFVMQYTGLKDKNGKEIYEGDIVHQYNEVERINSIGEVFYDPCEFFISSINGELSDDMAYNFNSSGGVNTKTQRVMWLEVIGNIYENSNLILQDK